MVEKIKITRKEIDELYDIEDAGLDAVVDKVVKEDDNKNFTFEEYTEYIDNKSSKEFKENAS